jgi:hypothetical protein
MKEQEIKNSIRKFYNIHKNSKLILDYEKQEFQMKLGDCTSIDIPFPPNVLRDKKLEELLND